MKQLTDNPQIIRNILFKIQNLSATTPSGFDLTNEAEYITHAKVVTTIGKTLLAKEFRDFEVDEYNEKVLQFLLLYFNNCKLAESIFPDENYKIHKQIMLIGKVGVGKTLLMEIFSEYLRITDNPNRFSNISLTEMIHYFKLNNHLDKFLYNELAESNGTRTKAKNFCLHDLGLVTYNHFGVDTKLMIDDFMYARYELFTSRGLKAHITSNMCVSELKTMFDARLIDRFKTYNIIDLEGSSRRK